LSSKRGPGDYKHMGLGFEGGCFIGEYFLENVAAVVETNNNSGGNKWLL
jgi:hypothetical protein